MLSHSKTTRTPSKSRRDLYETKGELTPPASPKRKLNKVPVFGDSDKEVFESTPTVSPEKPAKKENKGDSEIRSENEKILDSVGESNLAYRKVLEHRMKLSTLYACEENLKIEHDRVQLRFEKKRNEYKACIEKIKKNQKEIIEEGVLIGQNPAISDMQKADKKNKEKNISEIKFKINKAEKSLIFLLKLSRMAKSELRSLKEEISDIQKRINQAEAEYSDIYIEDTYEKVIGRLLDNDSFEKHINNNLLFREGCDFLPLTDHDLLVHRTRKIVTLNMARQSEMIWMKKIQTEIKETDRTYLLRIKIMALFIKKVMIDKEVDFVMLQEAPVGDALKVFESIISDVGEKTDKKIYIGKKRFYANEKGSLITLSRHELDSSCPVDYFTTLFKETSDEKIKNALRRCHQRIALNRYKVGSELFYLINLHLPTLKTEDKRTNTHIISLMDEVLRKLTTKKYIAIAGDVNFMVKYNFKEETLYSFKRNALDLILVNRSFLNAQSSEKNIPSKNDEKNKENQRGLSSPKKAENPERKSGRDQANTSRQRLVFSDLMVNKAPAGESHDLSQTKYSCSGLR